MGRNSAKNVSISTSKKSYELILEMPRDDENVRLFFGTSQFLGKFYIDNISLSRIEENPPTGISVSNINKREILIFPNPTRGAFTVQLSSINAMDEQSLEMFSLDGKLLFQTKLTGLKTEISPGQIQSGIYLIKVTSGFNCNTTRLVIN